MILGLLPLWLFLSVALAEADTFYAAPLSTSCYPDEPGTGTLNDPFKHPHYALYQKKVGCGDTLVLRGGIYQGRYSGFSKDTTHEQRSQACDDDYSDGQTRDESHTLLPLLVNCSAESPLIIQNYPGETVILDGTDADMAEENVWFRCESSSACGRTTGLNLPNPSRSYYTGNFNHGSSRTTQLWVDPAQQMSPGTRLAYVEDSRDLKAGTFAVTQGRVIIVQLPEGMSADPANHVMKMSGKTGDAAGNVITAHGSSHVIVRKHPDGGAFIVKYAYYGVDVDADGHHITVDGLDYIAVGGRDYGGCFRVSNGDYVTVKNGECTESMSHGIFFYGGGPDHGHQLSHCTAENMKIAHMGRAWIDGGGLGTSLGTGIIIKNCESCTARSNVIHDTFRNGIQVNYSAIDCDGGGKPCNSNHPLIEGNIVYNNCHFRNSEDDIIGLSDCAAINVVATAANNGEIKRAIIRNNMIRGAYTPPFPNDASPMGIHLDGKIPASVIINNTVTQTGGACISVQRNPEPVIIRNNIMADCGRCNGPSCNLYINSLADRHLTSNNAYWQGEYAVRVREGRNIVHRDIQTFEPTAIVAAPSFVSPTDLHLQHASPMIDQGTSTDAPKLDVDGEDRLVSGKMDIGADEWHGTPTTSDTPKPPRNLRILTQE
jgi:hypothetical protein